MNKNEQAVDYFMQGCSCSQAIVMSYGPDLGLPKEIGKRASGAFGGGVARRAEMCGAVSGSLMVLGLSLDKTVENPKETLYAKVHDFIRCFEERNGTVMCKQLLGVDIGSPEGREEFKQRNLMQSRCSKFVQDAADILDGFLAGEHK